MKSLGLRIAVTLTWFFAAIPALAQQRDLQATIPFDFTVGTHTLFAGEYHVSITGRERLRVARVHGLDVADDLTDSIRGVGNVTPRLIFHRYEKQYFLAEVWVGERNLGHQLFATAAELEVAKTTKQESVIILAQQLPMKQRLP